MFRYYIKGNNPNNCFRIGFSEDGTVLSIAKLTIQSPKQWIPYSFEKKEKRPYKIKELNNTINITSPKKWLLFGAERFDHFEPDPIIKRAYEDDYPTARRIQDSKGNPLPLREDILQVITSITRLEQAGPIIEWQKNRLKTIRIEKKLIAAFEAGKEEVNQLPEIQTAIQSKDIEIVFKEISRLYKNAESKFGIGNKRKADKILANVINAVNNGCEDVAKDANVRKALGDHRLFSFFGLKTADALDNVDEAMKQKNTPNLH